MFTGIIEAVGTVRDVRPEGTNVHFTVVGDALVNAHLVCERPFDGEMHVRAFRLHVADCAHRLDDSCEHAIQKGLAAR